MVHTMKIHFNEDYMMYSQQKKPVRQGSELPTRRALSQHPTGGHGRSLTVASFSLKFRFSEVTEFYNYLQAIFSMVT